MQVARVLNDDPARQWPCPEHIVNFVESVASLPGQRAIVSVIEEVKSAQQLVYVLSIDFHGTCTGTNVQSTRVAGSNRAATDTAHDFISDSSASFQRALVDGSNKLIVRIWKASARWWNLNNNDASCGERGVIGMARSEVAGYRMARAAIAAASSSSKIIIPDVLYFSHDYRKHGVGGTSDNRNNNDGRRQPWAIMTYVGDGSSYLSDSDSSNSHGCWVCDGQFVKDMIKTRHEYGFNEPHPRHGRVKEEKALEYSLKVMDTVVLPIQSAFFTSDNGVSDLVKCFEQDLQILSRMDDGHTEAYRYHDMVNAYRNATAQMTDTLTEQGICADTARIGIFVSTLDKCVEKLSTEASRSIWLSSQALPPTLCHMDLQPQNMILRRRKGDAYSVNALPHVSSVLDWEEACYADPRFEVLLMGRKVCASRKQADTLWAHYSRYLKEKHGLEVGPIEPWLKLEATHSITTLVMQSMGLIGGGRNAWESKPDLLGKIEREYSRLKVLGWDFVAQCAS